MAHIAYRDAVQWIAENDAPGDDCKPGDLSRALTVCLVADLFSKHSMAVAEDVWDARHPDEPLPDLDNWKRTEKKRKWM